MVKLRLDISKGEVKVLDEQEDGAGEGTLNDWSFDYLVDVVKDGDEALVLLACGEPHEEWVTGVTKILNDEGIAPSADPKEVWKEVGLLTTTGGRHDIALVFDGGSKLDVGKLAIWRLRFGDASWGSDYINNYADQHAAMPVDVYGDEDDEDSDDLQTEY